MVKNIDISDAEWIANMCIAPYDGSTQFTCGGHWA